MELFLDRSPAEPNMEDHSSVQSLQSILTHLVKEKQETVEEHFDYPFFLGDLRKIKHQYMKWKSLLPRIDIFYAMKCANEPPVIQLLSDLGASFDCASKREIETVLKLDVDSSRIIFANTIKSVSSLQFAADNNVSLMTFDNEEELDKIKKHYPQANLVIRIRCKDSTQVFLSIGMKFGCPLEHARQLLDKAKSLQLTVVGVSFHVGSGVSDPTLYETAIRDAHDVFDMGRRAGFQFHLLDIGGGFLDPIDACLPFATIAETLNTCLDQYFPQDSGVRIIAEPGRFMVSTAFTWVIQVIGKCSNESMEEGIVHEDGQKRTVRPRFMYYVNGGMFGGMPYNIQELPRLKVLKSKGRDPNQMYPSVVYGPTCAPHDVVYADVSLPELYIGDWLYLENAGAYSLALTTDFNMMPRPQCYYVSEEMCG